jgi:ribosomal protein S27E
MSDSRYIVKRYNKTKKRFVNRKSLLNLFSAELQTRIPKCGFARIRCPDCGEERLLMFSCRTRGFCPSCHAKRLEEWSEWMREKEGKVGYQHGQGAGEQEMIDYLEFIARVTSHIPDKGQVMVRCYGLYANEYFS